MQEAAALPRLSGCSRRATMGEMPAPSRMEQSVEVASGPSQFVSWEPAAAALRESCGCANWTCQDAEPKEGGAFDRDFRNADEEKLTYTSV
jgi:hypothetical protein